jgi:hypothetical protein
MRVLLATVAGVLQLLALASPVIAATEPPPAQEGLPVALIVAVVAGLLAFAYFLVRPTRITRRRD